MSARAGRPRRSLAEAVLDRIGELGLVRVLLLAVLLGGLGLAALGPVTDDPHALQVGMSAVAGALLGLLLAALSRRGKARQGRVVTTAVPAGSSRQPARRLGLPA